ncbi:MAG: hypothetical protein KJ561_05950 [Nanoarchaeota archaeon]|nr:hypothetical protein [Nanoarchaeota archaeon]
MPNHMSLKVQKTDGTHSIEFGVTQLPNRKMPCLYCTRGAMIEPLAYFRSEETAIKFDDILNMLLEATKER